MSSFIEDNVLKDARNILRAFKYDFEIPNNASSFHVPPRQKKRVKKQVPKCVILIQFTEL